MPDVIPIYVHLLRARDLIDPLVGESPGAYARRRRAGPPAPIPACFTLMYTRPVGSSRPGQGAE